MNKPQPDAPAGAPAPSEAGDLDRIVADLAKAGLGDYLSDADIAKQVVDWLHEETGIQRAFLELAIKAVAALVEQAAKESGSWLGRLPPTASNRSFAPFPVTRSSLTRSRTCLAASTARSRRSES